MSPLARLLRPYRLQVVQREAQSFLATPTARFQGPADAIAAANRLSRFLRVNDPEVKVQADFWISQLYLAALHLIPGTHLNPKTRGWYVLALIHLQRTLRRATSPLLARQAHFLMGVALQTYGPPAAAIPHYWSFLDSHHNFPLSPKATSLAHRQDNDAAFIALQGLAHLIPTP